MWARAGSPSIRPRNRPKPAVAHEAREPVLVGFAELGNRYRPAPEFRPEHIGSRRSLPIAGAKTPAALARARTASSRIVARGRSRHSGPGPRRRRPGAGSMPDQAGWTWRRCPRPSPFRRAPPRARRRRQSWTAVARPSRIRPRTKSPTRFSWPRSTGGGGPVLAAEDLAEIDRLAEMRAPVSRRADEEDRLALGLEGERRHLPPVGEQADAADRRRRRDRLAVGLVVERDVARDDREVERAAGFADAARSRRRTAP